MAWRLVSAEKCVARRYLYLPFDKATSFAFEKRIIKKQRNKLDVNFQKRLHREHLQIKYIYKTHFKISQRRKYWFPTFSTQLILLGTMLFTKTDAMQGDKNRKETYLKHSVS